MCVSSAEPNAANGTSEHVKDPTSESATVNGAADEAAEDGEEDGEAAQNREISTPLVPTPCSPLRIAVFQITVKLPHKPYDMPVMVRENHRL